MKEKELAIFLQVAKEDREEFREILRELLAEGKLTLTVKDKYMKSNGKVLTGTFISNAKGFGFVEVEGRDEDLFIPEDKQGGAFHKDTVEVALLPAKTGKRQEAQVIRIIARGMTQVVGTYEQSKSNFGFVIPDNTKIAQDIFVPKEWSKGAMTGHKVVVEITTGEEVPVDCAGLAKLFAGTSFEEDGVEFTAAVDDNTVTYTLSLIHI